ncbi:hypothetical protein UCRPC4_g00602 [Phaeomoniella chlamydospora]|uniref:Uncharacterized protein n=1 Tax=Phaeomoniella chlamydospora TaxID=158046 RepID=A0A0G2HJA8_PHACM|nr:hypothetical protein UCRPC4_g00602 [Phaeomoniella chlamydospora]
MATRYTSCKPGIANGETGPDVEADTNIYIPRQGTGSANVMYLPPQAPQYPQQASYTCYYTPYVIPAPGPPWFQVAYAQIAPAQVSTTNPHWHCFPSQPTSTGPVTNPTYGKTTAEVLRDNIALAERSGANKPREFVPYNTKPGQLLWCKELDGSFSLRTTTECMEELQPGSWFQTPEGKPFFVRRSK